MRESTRSWLRALRHACGSLVLCAAVLTACGGGGGGGGGITEPEIPDVTVATVALSSPATALTAGATLQLTATATNAAGSTLTGRSFSWQSSDAGVASVGASGLVEGHAEGEATITASTGGKSASVEITVVAPTAARVAVAPHFTAVTVGGNQRLEAVAYDAADDRIADATLEWESLDVAVVAVAADGEVSGVSAGQAQVVARADGRADTALVVVLAPDDLLATAFVGGDPTVQAAPGTTLTVPIVLDLTNVGVSGDLGSAQLELGFDPALLEYVSSTAGVEGAAELNVPTAGIFKLSFAATEPQSAATLTLATLTFRVAPAADPGAVTALSLTFTEPPSTTDFESYALPVSIGGRIRVIAP